MQVRPLCLPSLTRAICWAATEITGSPVASECAVRQPGSWVIARQEKRGAWPAMARDRGRTRHGLEQESRPRRGGGVNGYALRSTREPSEATPGFGSRDL